MDKNLMNYFNGDELAASVWKGKYAASTEKTPKDMFKRMLYEINKKSIQNFEGLKEKKELSEFGQKFFKTIKNQVKKKEIRYYNASKLDIFDKYLDNFKYIVFQGSIMSGLGKLDKIQSLSNCFVIDYPKDSYGGIFKSDEEIAQLEKRRGGVGLDISTLRPAEAKVSNSAGTSTGAHSFMERFSNTTREVAQNGRRGALMILMDCRHPDIFEFVKKKNDRTKVTGANVSVKLTDKFMEAVESDSDFICRFPVDDVPKISKSKKIPYNKVIFSESGQNAIMKVKAKELYSLIIQMAWENAEPGIAFYDRVIQYSPDGVYPKYRPIACNPCGEQWLQAYDACRLLAANFYNLVKNPFTERSELDLELAYEVFYVQQLLADIIVDLEIDYISRIIYKIEKDKEDESVKATELALWNKIKEVATSSRRTGSGFTALGDMLAALLIPYGSKESLDIVDSLMKVKLEAELDCSIDLAILYSPFDGYNADLEFEIDEKGKIVAGRNAFYQMLLDEYPAQCKKMVEHGRRNVSWSTVAPTGSLSILTQTTSGTEPLFLPYYLRKKKVNPSDKNVRVDFVDKTGDSWTSYPVIHPKLEDWIIEQSGGQYTRENVKDITEQELLSLYAISPWYGSCANEIHWKSRVEMQAVIQKYTTNAISSTINLPKDISKEVVYNIYLHAWKTGLKGVTVYRDGSRDGVLTSTTTATNSKFSYKDATKRPKELECKIHKVSIKGEIFYIVIGLLDNNPYELFVSKHAPTNETNNLKIIKKQKGQYVIVNENNEEFDITLEMTDEQAVITRLISSALRHGTDVKFLVEQLNKTHGDMTSFSKAIARSLKNYILEGSVSTIACSECGGTLVFEEGCSVCKNCGNSKCG